MANLQLFKVNGVPILNLKHLAKVLDTITKPHATDASEKTETVQLTETAGEGSAPEERDCRLREDGPTNEFNVAERTDGEDYPSFKAFSEDARADERARFTCGVRSSRAPVAERSALATTITAEHRDCGERESSPQPSSSDNAKPSPSSCNPLDPIYAGLDDDPTLLMRRDYVHFELDKDKIIVLNIPTASKFSPEILEQYAIAKSRSDNLPMPSWAV